MVDLSDIRAAAARISGLIHRTPLLGSATLAQRAGARVVELKCESLQKTGSFKVRGALNNLLQLDDRARSRGVVSVSAGNHAQALAWAARTVGTPCTVCMPETASRAKVDASKGYGARVILLPTSMDAFRRALELAESEGFTFIHPFDDDRTIAGAGTTGLEILEQTDAPDVVVVPIGGGGLIGGIAVAIREASSSTRVIGVEPIASQVMRQSLVAGSPQRATPGPTIADGLAAPMAGERNYEIVRKYVDDVVLVSEEEILEAMGFLLTRCKLLPEGAGAAATAALLSGKIRLSGSERVVALLSGGNVDLDKLPS